MQEPVYVLRLITCHGRIMPRLAELLLCICFTKPDGMARSIDHEQTASLGAI